MIPRGRQVDEADLANKTADATDTTEANEAEANVADEAEANEAEGAANEADVAEEANVIDEIDAANKANVTNKANVINEIVGTNEAIDTNEVDDTNEAIDAEEAEADKADEAEEANVSDEANSTVISSKADVTNLLLPFSLTKCSAFFSEDKVYFGIRFNVCNNKLLVTRSRDELDKLVEAEGPNNNQFRGCFLCSLITWNRVDNQLGFLAENV